MKSKLLLGDVSGHDGTIVGQQFAHAQVSQPRNTIVGQQSAHASTSQVSQPRKLLINERINF